MYSWVVGESYGREPGAKRHFLSAPFFVLFYAQFNHFHFLFCAKVLSLYCYLSLPPPHSIYLTFSLFIFLSLYRSLSFSLPFPLPPTILLSLPLSKTHSPVSCVCLSLCLSFFSSVLEFKLCYLCLIVFAGINVFYVGSFFNDLFFLIHSY